MNLFVVGKTTSVSDEAYTWEICGVFNDENVAVANCKDYNYFVGPITLNEALADETTAWPGAYYPNASKDAEQ
ncbi:MAG: hypothetical protein V4628_11560 [Pseudomonadota bacterium]